MKSTGQFLVGFWVLWSIRCIYIANTDPYYNQIKWGFSLLILGIILWYKGHKKEKEKEWEDWKKENVKDYKE